MGGQGFRLGEAHRVKQSLILREKTRLFSLITTSSASEQEKEILKRQVNKLANAYLR